MSSLNNQPLAEDMASLNEWAKLIINYLERHLPVPTSTQVLVSKSVLRQIDSEMIIEDGCAKFPELPISNYAQELPKIDCLEILESIIESIYQEGFSKYFVPLTSALGNITNALYDSDEQRANINDWGEKGYGGSFMMTDSGGSSLHSWKTVYNAETGMLTVDKKWGINAHTNGFLTIVTSQPGSVIPVAILVPPESCKELQRKKIGRPYLDGAVQLGNCSGEIAVKPEWFMKKGGILAVKQFLSIIRPYFVRGLMAHITWLESQGRLRQSDEQKETNSFLVELSKKITSDWSITRYSEDEVMALKFVSNALLFDLVETGSVELMQDQRDLLAFTKMEGSSYRCFMEIYARSGKRKWQK